jgi:hypothetical protein
LTRHWFPWPLAVGLVVLGLCACKRTSTNAAASRPNDAGSLSSAGAPSDGSESAAGSSGVQRDRAQQLLFAWNTASDSHDVDSLKALYASHVAYYGTKKTSDKVIQAKRSAFERSPKFRQRIDNLRIEPSDQGFRVTFRKRSGENLDSVVNARLAMREEGERLVIAEETDAATDRMLERLEPKDCAAAALRAAEEHWVIVKDRARVAREWPEAIPAGLIWTETPAGVVDARVGYILPHKFDPVWSVTVEKGELAIRSALTGEPLAVPEYHRAKVRRICETALRGP